MQLNNLLPLIEYVKDTNPSHEDLVSLMKKLQLHDSDVISGLCTYFSDEQLAECINKVWDKESLSEGPEAFSCYKFFYSNHKYKTCLSLFKNLEQIIDTYNQPLYHNDLLMLIRQYCFLHENTALLNCRDKFKEFEELQEYLYKYAKSKKSPIFANNSKTNLKIDWLITYHDKETLHTLEKKEKFEVLKESFNYILNTLSFMVNESFFRYHTENPQFLDYLLEKNYIDKKIYDSLQIKIQTRNTDFIKYIISETIQNPEYYIDKMNFYQQHSLPQFWFEKTDYQKNPVSYKQAVVCKEAVFIMKNYFEKNEFLIFEFEGKNISLSEDENKFILNQVRNFYNHQHSRLMTLEDINHYLSDISPHNVEPEKVMHICTQVLKLKESYLTVVERELLKVTLQKNLKELQKFKL